MALGDILRTAWRRIKEPVLAGRGNLVQRMAYRSLARVVKRCKKSVSATDLGDLALWLMYHPESRVLPCEGWKMTSPPDLGADEMERLRERYRADTAAVERRLSLETVVPETFLGSWRQDVRIAVHVHSFFPEIFPRIHKALECIPVPFDLFVSVPDGISIPAELDGAERCAIVRCPNRGRDIAPFLCLFGRRLMDYDYVAHFHSKKSPHVAENGDWLGHSLNHLLGGVNRVKGILGALDSGYGIVAPPEFSPTSEDPTGWMRNLHQAQALVRLGGVDVDLARDFMPIPFPKGSMFWARSDFLRRFFALPLSFEDFPEEPIGIDGTPAHALERLFFLWGMGTGLKVGRLAEVYDVR